MNYPASERTAESTTFLHYCRKSRFSHQLNHSSQLRLGFGVLTGIPVKVFFDSGVGGPKRCTQLSVRVVLEKSQRIGWLLGPIVVGQLGSQGCREAIRLVVDDLVPVKSNEQAVNITYNP